jgi:hypothetical protein
MNVTGRKNLGTAGAKKVMAMQRWCCANASGSRTVPALGAP